jgi:flagellar basal-body rod protein FlgF
MADGIYIALSGAVAQQNALDVVSNNVANAQTTGFRGQKVSFGEMLVQAATPTTPTGAAYVAIGKVTESAAQGPIQNTTNPLDLALVGDGYFAVDTARGPRYTRAGSFRISTEGQLVDQDGHVARAAGGGSINIPETTKLVTVQGDGTVVADGEALGTLELVRFAPAGLQREGGTLYAALPNVQALEGTPEVLSGALEGSNVNSVGGVVDLVKVSRTYEALLSAIDTFREVDKRAARELGGPK